MVQCPAKRFHQMAPSGQEAWICLSGDIKFFSVWECWFNTSAWGHNSQHERSVPLCCYLWLFLSSQTIYAASSCQIPFLVSYRDSMLSNSMSDSPVISRTKCTVYLFQSFYLSATAKHLLHGLRQCPHKGHRSILTHS